MITKDEEETIDIKEVIEQYSENPDIFNDESETTKKIKHFIFNNLDEVDRRIILLYAELQSLRKLGKVLGISPSSAFIKIKQIKTKLKDVII